ncbi:MAG: hypothetical protein SGJ11_16345, partial [Phycisphaerae bacterium]|nr:hypothetical protein [Phycisphaerae bacterium]
TIASLSITDGMGLDTANSQLIVAGPGTISGQNQVPPLWPSRLIVADGPALYDAVIGALTVSDGGWIEMDGGTLVVNNVFTLGESARLRGTGTIIVDGDQPVALVFDGMLDSSIDDLTLIQNGTGRIDLDGTVAGDVLPLIHGGAFGFDALEIQGVGLADAMDDFIWLSEGNQLTMLLDEGWTLGPSAALRVIPSSFTELPAFVNGGHLTVNGSIFSQSAGDSGVHLIVTAPVTLNASASIHVDAADEIDFDGATTIDGADHEIDEGAKLRFNGATDVLGGTFTTFSSSLNDGGVEFNGNTDYNGDVTIDGAARQNGDVYIFGQTTISADTFDMDGSSGNTAWSIATPLVINANSVDAVAGQPFDGELDLTGTFLGKLTINLANPNAHWTMAGTLDVGGVGALMITRVAGSPMWVSGEINVTNAVSITADASLLISCDVQFASASARLRFGGTTTVHETASFLGGGRLENSASGDMTLGSTLNLTGSDLLNAGTLRVGSSPGLAIVADLTFEPTSTWVVEIGGPTFGTQFDQLNASGPAQVAGALDVHLIDLGGGVYQPIVGEAFTILNAAPGQLSGAFANPPVSFTPNKVYKWTVSYAQGGPSSSATLIVEQIVPCPGDVSGDGTVDATDLAIVLGAWGPCPT